MPRGGKRPGAGRPAGAQSPDRKVMVSFRLQPAAVRWLKSHGRPMTEVIEDLIKKQKEK